MDGNKMLGQPAGWFRDPAPRDPEAPDTWRYWNGTGWTARTRTGTKAQRRAWREEAAAERVAHVRDLLERAADGDATAEWELDSRRSAPVRRSTATGHGLAGWWARVAASVLDSLLVNTVGVLLSWPFLHRVMTAVDEFVAAATAAAERGDELPSTIALLESLTGPLLATTVVLLCTSLVFEVGFLMSHHATPGKMALGLQVRPRRLDASLTWGAAVLRWTGKSGVGLVQLVPLGFLPYGLYVVLDRLWPLGDRNRQALHDKLAGTCVVRRA